jgi:hypothetical protein
MQPVLTGQHNFLTDAIRNPPRFLNRASTVRLLMTDNNDTASKKSIHLFYEVCFITASKPGYTKAGLNSKAGFLNIQ